jgi:hypothetical protein
MDSGSVRKRRFKQGRHPTMAGPIGTSLPLALTLVCGFMASLSQGAESQSIPARSIAASPPKVLIFVTDDHRADGTLDVMPRTRSWFEQGGIRFPNAFATPRCAVPGEHRSSQDGTHTTTGSERMEDGTSSNSWTSDRPSSGT